MKSYEAMYHTPLGFNLVRFQAESMEEAKCAAESKCQFGIVELVWVKSVNVPEIASHPARSVEFTYWP